MEPQTKLESLIANAILYAETNIQLWKLKTVDKVTTIAASFIWRLCLVFLLIIALLFINIGIAIWVGNLLNGIFYGFLAVGAFYLFLGLIVYYFRYKLIKYPLRDFLIKKLIN